MVLALVAAGCSGGDNDADADAKATPKESVAPVDTSKVSPRNLPKVPAIAKAKGAITDAKMGKCPTAAGQRRVQGTVKNSTGGTTDYLVVVNWINDTSDVLSRGVQTIKGVPAGESREFVVRAKVAKGASQCTFLVQRGTVG